MKSNTMSERDIFAIVRHRNNENHIIISHNLRPPPECITGISVCNTIHSNHTKSRYSRRQRLHLIWWKLMKMWTGARAGFWDDFNKYLLEISRKLRESKTERKRNITENSPLVALSLSVIVRLSNELITRSSMHLEEPLVPSSTLFKYWFFIWT